MKIEYSNKDHYLAYVEIIGAIVLIGFWIGWFAGILKSYAPTDEFYSFYMIFESSFPIADFWIVILLLISAFGILKNRSYGLFFAAAAGGALIFLGLIDATFNIQNGVYQHDPLSIIVNLASLLGGTFALIWFGRYFIKE
ncbi:MAG: hypothetical protein EAX86_03265 [Candidatus Heimdallarchaeota archaeon]|nr:hypothetical protein [Candidatus Heimdallarchaeota archaeon]